MSGIEALDELRKWANGVCYVRCGVDFDRALEYLEREIDKRFMELPVDANGVPVRVGDTLVEHEDGHEFTVDGLKITGGAWWAFKENGVQAPVSRCTHVKHRTLEGVLEEYGVLFEAETDDIAPLVKRYADEIRGLMEGCA